MTRGKRPATVSGRREAITCSVAACGGAPVRRGDEPDACPRVMHNGVPVVCPCGTHIGHHPATIQQPSSNPSPLPESALMRGQVPQRSPDPAFAGATARRHAPSPACGPVPSLRALAGRPRPCCPPPPPPPPRPPPPPHPPLPRPPAPPPPPAPPCHLHPPPPPPHPPPHAHPTA